MGVLERLQNFFRPVQMIFKGTAPYLFTPYTGNPVWHMLDFLAYGREGYEQNSLIHAAIKYKVQAIAQTRMRVYRGDPDNPEQVTKHPYQQLILRPNNHQSWREMEGYQEAVLNLSGNAYTYLARPPRGGRADALYPLRPDRVFIIPGERELRGFLYVPLGATREQGVPLLVEDVMHVKYPNPLDDFEGMGYGLSPMRALAQSGDIDNQATRVLKRNFDQGMMLAGILKFNMPMDADDMQAARRKWMERYGGSANAGDIGVLDINADYKRIAPTFKELGFAEIDERNESRILAPLGVPAILLDTRIAMKSSTYANKAEARKAFWEDTMLYEIGAFDAEYAQYLRDGDVFLLRDLSTVPALQKNIPELVNAAKALWEMGVPVHQAATTVGLKLGDVPGGDVGYLPANVLPVGQVPARGDKSYSLPPARKATSETFAILATIPHHQMIKVIQDVIRGQVGAMAEWQKPETYHLTLAMGTGTRAQIEQIDLSGNLLALVVDKIDQFDTPDGYAIYLRVRRSADLLSYQARLVAEMQAVGMAVSDHSLAFTPHITLGYTPEPITALDITPIVFGIDTVVVSNSDHTPIRQTQLKTLKSRWSDDEKKALWYKVDSIAQKWEKKFGAAAVEAFEADKRACIALAADHAGKSHQAKATIDWMKLAPKVASYFRRTSPTKWRDAFTPVMAAMINDAGNFWGAELGLQWNVRNFLAEEWFATYTLQFAQPINQTSSDFLQGIIAQAQAEGWSIDKMTQRMGQVFDQWKDGNLSAEDLAWVEARQPQYRREMIARTETTRLQAEGTRRLFSDWEITEKEWLATQDDRCRPSHTAANGQVRPMDEPFKVGGFDMLGPGDMSMGAPVSEIVLCRCTLLPVME